MGGISAYFDGSAVDHQRHKSSSSLPQQSASLYKLNIHGDLHGHEQQHHCHHSSHNLTSISQKPYPMMNISSVSSHIFAFFFLTLFVSMNIQPASSQCLKSQMSLLLQLRSSLGFDRSESTKLVSWNNRTDCCQWRGVRCDGATGYVIGLDLSGEWISEMDNSSSLFELRFLESLNLANNGFSDVTIPPGIGRLSGTLTRLNLSNAGFSGQVPLELSKLTKLVVLDLSVGFSSPYYFGTDYFEYSNVRFENPSFGMIIRNLTNIRELYLDGVSISARGHEWCEAVSSSLPNLQVLSLSNCYLSGEIDHSLSKLESLSVIHLDHNNLSADVPEFMAGFRNLTSLVLSSCGLIGVFPEKIFTVPTLEALNLADNPLLQGTLPEFAVDGSLQTLLLAYTSFTGNLPDSISRLTRLRSVDLTFCVFGGEIPPFSMATNLTQLILYGNNLSSFTDHAYWKNLSKLANLHISNNSLRGRIPESLFSIPSLEKLQLSQNLLSGQLDEFLMISSPVIDTIDLSNNNLEGPIPKSFFRLQGLDSLKLSSNNFNGSLDLTVIRQLKNITTLDLSNNNLSIETNGDNENISSFPQLYRLSLSSCNLRNLPNFLKNQSKLTYLDLSDNQIEGKIPAWIWKIGNGSLSSLNLSCNYFQELEQSVANTSSLIVLDIHSNKLRGQLPIFPPGVVYLDLSDNNFTSIIPKIGVSLTSVVFLSLSRNNISGRIPGSICNASYLEVLDISNNQMDGEIPDCLAESLVVWNLRGNRLNGSIPDTFTENCRLRTIDFNGNFIVGQIPRSVAKCSNLEVLDIGNNHLNGTFPSWLGDSFNLRVLVLRSNEFSGSIPCPWPQNNLTWPRLQIIDLAANHFDGELKTACFSKWPAMLADTDKTDYLKFRIFHYSTIYYQDVVTVTVKGLELNLQKILTVFTSIDFSNNGFTGEIPESLGNLKGLIALNLSHNSLSGSIPPSVGNISELESLDLSYNQLNGSIPEELVNLNFLSFLNLSFNKLVGEIPNGKQFDTFPRSSFEGNQGLCGLILNKQCGIQNHTTNSQAAIQQANSHSLLGPDLQFILVGIGFGAGSGTLVSTLMFWRKGRKWYDKQMDRFLGIVLSPFGIVYAGSDGRRTVTDENIGSQLFDFTYDEVDDEYGGRFCVFCSKLDIERKKVIHNPQCTCHVSSSMSSSSSSSSSLR